MSNRKTTNRKRYLYPHNQDFLAYIEDSLEAGKSVAGSVPIGAGSKFLILKFIENHPDSHLLILTITDQSKQQLQYHAQDKTLLRNTAMFTYSELEHKKNKQRIANHKPEYIILNEYTSCGIDNLWRDSVNRIIEETPTALHLGQAA